jgi:hypothetical protein
MGIAKLDAMIVSGPKSKVQAPRANVGVSDQATLLLSFTRVVICFLNLGPKQPTLEK